jgi:hypothetical protein
MALAEVAISASVLLVMLGLATLALTAYLRGTHQLFQQRFPADAMARSLQRSTRVLRSAQAVVWPSRAELTSYRPQQPERAPLVVQVRTAGASQFRGLTLDSAREHLVLVEYPAAFDPAQPYPAQARYVVLGPARGLVVQLTGEQLQVQLEAEPTQAPWVTGLDVHGLPMP